MDATSTTTGSLLNEIYRLRDVVDGVQVIWSLPKHIDSTRVFNVVPLSKDFDGIHFALWGSNFPPVMTAGVMEFLKGHNIDVHGKHVLVVGRSPIVGSPMALMLQNVGLQFLLHANCHTMWTRRHYRTLCQIVMYSFRVQVLLVLFMRIGSKRELP